MKTYFDEGKLFGGKFSAGIDSGISNVLVSSINKKKQKLKNIIKHTVYLQNEKMKNFEHFQNMQCSNTFLFAYLNSLQRKRALKMCNTTQELLEHHF